MVKFLPTYIVRDPQSRTIPNMILNVFIKIILENRLFKRSDKHSIVLSIEF